jgi:hypothetical protein
MPIIHFFASVGHHIAAFFASIYLFFAGLMQF